MLRLSQFFFILFATTFGFVAPVFAEEPKPLARKNVLERFEVARNGNALVLPVQFKGKTYRFILDTGASVNLFDVSLPLGDPIAEINAKGDGEKQARLKVFSAPPASLGS